MSIRLSELTIENFKSFMGAHHLDLAGDIIVLLGNTGAGKTTLLDAIDFALFGSTYETRKIKELTLDDLINDHSDELKVSLTLSSDGSIFTVTRSKVRGKSPVATLLTPKKRIKKNVEKRIASMVAISPHDFSRRVLIRSRELYDLIYGSDMERSVVIDDLIGISALEDLFKAFPLRLVKERLSTIKEEKRKILSEHPQIGRVGDQREELRDKQEELKAVIGRKNSLEKTLKVLTAKRDELKRKREEFLSLQQRRSRLEIKREEMELLLSDIPSLNVLYDRRKSLLTELHGLLDDPSVSLSVDGIENVLKRQERGLIELDAETIGPTLASLAKLKTQKEEIEKQLKSLEEEIQLLEPIEGEFRRYTAKYGSLDEIEQRIIGLRREIEETRHRVAMQESRLKILNAIISSLADGGRASCPVCGSTLDKDSLSMLRSLLHNSENTLILLRGKISEMTSLVNELSAIKQKLEKLGKDIFILKEKKTAMNNTRSKLQKFIVEIKSLETKLGKLKEEKNKKVMLINKLKELIEVNRRLKLAEQISLDLENVKSELEAITPSMDELDYSEEEYLEVINKVAEARYEYDSIKRREAELKKAIESLKKQIIDLSKADRKLKEISEREKRLESLLAELTEIRESYRVIQTKLRRQLADELSRIAGDVFSDMYSHGEFSNVKVGVREIESRIGRRSVYEFYVYQKHDKTWIQAPLKLSEGQRLLLMLSILIAASKLNPHNLGFLILDEPLAELDRKCKESFVSLLLRSNQFAQIIVATQSEEMASLFAEYGQVKNVKVFRVTKKDGLSSLEVH